MKTDRENDVSAYLGIIEKIVIKYGALVNEGREKGETLARLTDGGS